MTEPTLYQLDDVLLTGYSLTDIRRLVRNGVLMPVERCEHGNIDPHTMSTQGLLPGAPSYRCPGAGIGDNE